MSHIKVHCSTGQVADGYPDPVTGKPINFNMLPHHADKRLGVLPHTVQHYGLTDPAPTYGNTNFGYMRNFLREEVGTRPVVYYPETAAKGSTRTRRASSAICSLPTSVAAASRSRARGRRFRRTTFAVARDSAFRSHATRHVPLGRKAEVEPD